MPIDSELLPDAIETIRKGEPLKGEERKLVVRVLSMVGGLAFYGADLEGIHEELMKKSNRQNINTLFSMMLLSGAHKAGRGVNEAHFLINARRENKHKIPALVNYVKEVEGVTQTTAQRKVAEALGMEFFDVKSSYARWKRKKKTQPE